MTRQPKVRTVDDSVMERLINAVDSVVLLRDVSKALAAAIVQIVANQEADFPTEPLKALFRDVVAMHESVMKRANSRDDIKYSRNRHDYLEIAYRTVGGRTKHTLKEGVWKLFRACLNQNRE